MRDYTPTARCIHINTQDPELSVELPTFKSASLSAEACDRGNVTEDFYLNIGAMNKSVSVRRILDQLNLLSFVDDLAVVRDAGEIVAEDSVKDGGVVELDRVSETLFEISDGLAVSFLVGPVVVLSEHRNATCEQQKGEQGQFFHSNHSNRIGGTHGCTPIE